MYERSCTVVDQLEICESMLKGFRLNILTYNIRSISHNFDQFLLILNRINIKFDVIVLTECWLQEGTIVGLLDGYTSYRSRKFINKAGGVVIYVRSSWNAVMDEPSEIRDANCITIDIPNKLTVLGIYRSPSFKDTSNFLNSLDTTLQNLTSNKCLVLAGDINIDIMPEVNSHSQSEYLCLTAEHGLVPAINKPTRLNSCLDHIFVNNKVTSEGVVCTTATTDHDLAMVGLSVSHPNKKNLSRLVQRVNYNAIEEELKAVDWSDVLQSTVASEAANYFTNILSKTIEKHTEIIKVSRSKYNLKPWITPGLLRCMRHRDALHAKARKHPSNPILQVTYKRYRNFFINLLHKLKHEYERSNLLENTGNPKRLWATINNICHAQKQNSSATELLTTHNTTADSLNSCNDYFSTVGKNLANITLQRLGKTEEELASEIPMANVHAQSLFMLPTDEHEVGKIIKRLQVKCAPGLDCIHNKLINQTMYQILPPLTHIINTSLQTGEFPVAWKTAAVCPIHKDGAKNNPANYRPISLLSTLSKLLEKIVNSRLMKFIEQNELLPTNQYGFRKGMSTEDAVGDLTDLVSSILDEGRACVGVFLDLAKAFDTVSIPILLKKLEYFGVRGVALKWFQTYLTHRKQCVKIDGLISSETTTSYGVPQGSILGPSLFLVYLSDIAAVQLGGAELFCYADDTAVIFQEKDWCGAFQAAEKGMTRLGEWLSKNLLTLNTTKTKFVSFHKTRASAPPFLQSIKVHKCDQIGLNCDCPEIKGTTNITYLGVTLDENLSFQEHINKVTKKIRKSIYIMKILRHSADIKLLRLIYKAICQSVLSYCLSVWGGAQKTIMLVIERAQRAVLKVMLRKPRRYPTANLYDDCQLLSVRKLYLLKATITTHQALITSPNHDAILTKRIYQAPTIRVETTFARRFGRYLHAFVYNKITKSCDLKQLTMREVKHRVTKWLLTTLTYDAAEDLLNATI